MHREQYGKGSEAGEREPAGRETAASRCVCTLTSASAKTEMGCKERAFHMHVLRPQFRNTSTPIPQTPSSIDSTRVFPHIAPYLILSPEHTRYTNNGNSPTLPLLHHSTKSNSPNQADKLRTQQQLESLQQKYVGTGHADTTRHEWTANIARDSYSSYVGHAPLLHYMAIGGGECVEKVRMKSLEGMVLPVGPAPVVED